MDRMNDFLKELHKLFKKYDANITIETVESFEDAYNVLEICVADSNYYIHTQEGELNADEIIYLLDKME